MNVPLILGVDWLCKYQAIIDFKRYMLILQVKDTIIQIQFNERASTESSYESLQIKIEGKPNSAFDIEDFEWEVYHCDLNSDFETEVQNKCYTSEALSDKEKTELGLLLREYKTVFSDNPGCIKDYICRLKIKENKPFFKKPYLIPSELKEAAAREIDKMVEQRIIERSLSAFNNPLWVVKKANGGVRLVLDARELNKIIEMECDHQFLWKRYYLG